MLSDLLKPGWQSKSADKRLQTIRKMDAQDDANQHTFETLAQDDPEASVRHAALKKLSRPESVFEISQGHADSLTREQAESALSELLGANSKLSESQFRELISSCPVLTPAIVKWCPHAGLRAELLHILSEQELSELIAGVEYSETRIAIAERLSLLEPLECGRKSIKGKDKKAEKIIKTKLDILYAEQRQHQESMAAAQRLCESMEYLAAHATEWRSEFNVRFAAVTQQWDVLNFTSDKNLGRRYEQASVVAHEATERQEKVDAAVLGQQQLVESFESYCNELARLPLKKLCDQKSLLSEKLKSGLLEWAGYADVSTPGREASKPFSRAQAALKSVETFVAGIGELDADISAIELDDISSATILLEKTIAGLHWPDQYPGLEARAEAVARLDALKAQAKKAQKAAAGKLDKLHKRINRLLGSTKRGELGRAKRELAAVTKAAGHYGGEEKALLDERLAKAVEAVDKMGDWKDFVTEPKYIELCEAMEALVGSKTHADKLSTEIKELQKRWKALGHSNSAEQHWERFKSAGDKAYEPCAVFFKQRRATQHQNLEKREPFLQQMRELLENTDWDGLPDYKQVEAVLRRISNDWQKIKDVERGTGQKQWNKLSKFRAAIYEKLDVIYDANIEAKNLLIEQAQVILETDVKEETLSKLKLLQTRWKQVGVTRRKDDQAAWKRFKLATDGVYEKIQGIRKAKRADEDAQLDAYRQIIRQMQALAKSGSDLAEVDSNFDRLQAEYKELPTPPKIFPEKLTRVIDADFQRAVEAVGNARDQINRAGRAAAMKALTDKAALCSKLEQLSTSGATTKVDKSKVDKLVKAMANIEIKDRKLNSRFEKRLEAALKFNIDHEQASRDRQLLCIDLEIFLGLDSPKEDTELRMKVQLERLKSEGLGQGKPKKQELLDKIKIDWLCMSAAKPKTQQKLDKRFTRLVDKH